MDWERKDSKASLEMEEWILKHPVRKTLSLAEPGLKLFSPCRIYFMGIPSLTQPDVEWLVL